MHSLQSLDRNLRRGDTAAARAIEALSPQRGRAYRHSAAKRAADILLSAVGLFLSGPLIFLLLAIGKIVDPDHPAFFVQERVGPGLKPLGVVKLRSMHRLGGKNGVNASATVLRPGEASGGLHDPSRVTAFGRLLRTYHLDELPQLVHVLHGDLSLVGIRVLPLPVYRYLERTWSSERFAAWAEAYDDGPLGLTGVHQVYRKGGKEDAKRFHRDMFYTRRASLGLDLYLIWRTVVSWGRARE